MPPCITRLLRSMTKPHPDAQTTARPTELDSIRAALLQTVDDCAGPPTRQLQIRIRSARTHRDLWMLRSDAYHLIALHHCQSIADQRIRRLLHLFVGWVAPQELSRVT